MSDKEELNKAKALLSESVDIIKQQKREYEMLTERADSLLKDLNDTQVRLSLTKDRLNKLKQKPQTKHYADSSFSGTPILIQIAAKRASIAAAEALLEKTVKYRDAKGVKAATDMIHNTLIKPYHYEPYPRMVKGFWKNWVDTKEHFDFMAKIEDALALGRKLISESEASLRHRKHSTKQTWNADSLATSKQIEGFPVGHNREPPGCSTKEERDALIQKREDWRATRKWAKDTLDKARRDN